MLRVLPNPAAPIPRGTPHSGKYIIGVPELKPLLMQMLLLAFLNFFLKNPNLTKKEKMSLEMFIKQARTLLRDKWEFIMRHLNDQVLLDSLHSMVPFPTMFGFDTLESELQKIAEMHYRKMGVPLNSIFECDTIVDAVNHLFVCNEVFMDIFVNHVWVSFRTDLKVANQMARKLENLSNLPPQVVHTYAAIVARTAVTFSEIPSPVAQALVQGSQPSAPHPVSEPVLIVSVLPDPPPRNDATDLILPVVESVLQSCVTNAATLAVESFAAGNRSNVMENTGDELDAQVLATEVTRAANAEALEATAKMFAALKVVGLVTAAAYAGESVQSDDQSSAEFVPGNLEAAELFLKIAGESDHKSHANGAGGPLSVISERTQDGADNSGTPSPLPDGERRAPFTTSDQSPLHGVEDGSSRDHPPFSAADLCRSAAGPKSSLSDLESIPPSGQSVTHQTHKLANLIASQPFLSLSFTPAHPKLIIPSSEGTGIGVSPQAQSSDKSSGNVTYSHPLPNLLASLDPLLPTQSSSSRGHNIGVGGAHSSDIQSNSALFHVDVRGNPHADQLSFLPQGNVEDPPVQVLASSGNPPRNSSRTDHPETPLSFKLGSSCFPDGKTRSSFQRQQAQQSHGLRSNYFRSGKNRVHPSHGDTGNTRPPVAHSSDNSSESAATNPPLSHIVVLPAGRIGIGGSGSSQVRTDPSASPPPPNLFGTNGKPVRPLPPIPVLPSSVGTEIGGIPRAHSPDDPSEIVPPSAPSSSSELGSAAAAALSPQSCPSGHEKGGIERNEEMLDFDDWYPIAHQLKRCGVPNSQVQLFSHLALEFKGTQGIEVA